MINMSCHVMSLDIKINVFFIYKILFQSITQFELISSCRSVELLIIIMLIFILSFCQKAYLSE